MSKELREKLDYMRTAIEYYLDHSDSQAALDVLKEERDDSQESYISVTAGALIKFIEENQ